ncbi:hypothetical protein LCGC14_2163690, partial [marine sediment metagenome]
DGHHENGSVPPFIYPGDIFTVGKVAGGNHGANQKGVGVVGNPPQLNVLAVASVEVGFPLRVTLGVGDYVVEVIGVEVG